MKWLLKLISLTLMLLCLCSCSNETITPEQAYCPIEIGVVMDINGIDDNSYNELVWKGVTDYANSAVLSTSCFKYFESTTEMDYVPYLQSFADSVDIVIATSPEMADELYQVASEYQKVTFVIVDAIVEAPNVVSLNYDEKLLAFIAGRLAAEQVIDPAMESVAYIGDSIELAAIYEQSVLLVNENIHVEYEFDELHVYDSVVAAYNENSLNNVMIENALMIATSIVNNENVIIKNISDDIYEIIREKARRRLTMGNYNSTNFSLNFDISYDVLKECKNIVNAVGFLYAELPTYMIVVEDNSTDSETLEETETIEK